MRAWQAEAVEDGRLSGEERASFERHAQTCRVCAGERRALAALRQAAERLPLLSASPLERRRLRQNLLGRANDVAQNARRPGAWRLAAVGAAAVALGAIALVSVVTMSNGSPPAEHHVAAALSVPTFQMRVSTGGVWHTAERGPTLRLALERGVFSLHVDKLVTGQRFIANLPDGELEVRGTRFTVDVGGGRTRRVSVSQGHVALRIHGLPQRMLGPGESWQPGASAPRVAAASSQSPSSSALAEAHDAPPTSANASVPLASRVRSGFTDRRRELARARTAPTRRRAPAAAPHPVAAASASAAPRKPTDPAAVELDAAMGAYRDGNFARAQKLFAAFERHHPGDARSEDAAFLRAVACLRRGDRTDARALARDYLNRYPDGLRREEAQRLLAH